MPLLRISSSNAEADDGDAPTRKRYLPVYTASGDLILPKNFKRAFLSTDDLQRLAACHEAQVAQLRRQLGTLTAG